MRVGMVPSRGNLTSNLLDQKIECVSGEEAVEIARDKITPGNCH